MLNAWKARKYRSLRRGVSALVSVSLAAWGPLTVALLMTPTPAGASSTITNNGSAIYNNESAAAQPPVVGTATVTVKANPVLTVVKTANPATAASGATVEYALTLAYPQIGGACGDDSNAVGVTLTDTIPAGMTYAVNSTSVSVDGGATYGLITDGGSNANASVNFVSNQVRVTFTNPIVECTTGATARVVKFRVTVN